MTNRGEGWGPCPGAALQGIAEGAMRQAKNRRPLARGVYLTCDQTAGARRELMDAAQRVVPLFFERLREDVYPHFARIARKKPNYWQTGWKFATWHLTADRENELAPELLSWARQFNAGEAGESWILEGALQTLWLWNQYPKLRTALNIEGFYPPSGGLILTSDDERCFNFEHPGWDPQFQRWADYRAYVKDLFDKELRSYERRIRTLIESRKAVPTRARYSVHNFEWFALYQFGGLSQSKIAELYTTADETPDLSTIRKGLKAAAALVSWQNLRKGKHEKWEN